MPRPLVRWLCFLPDVKAFQFMSLEQVVARLLKVVELKLSAKRTRTRFVTTANANYDLRNNGHNTDIVDLANLLQDRRVAVSEKSQIEGEPCHRR